MPELADRAKQAAEQMQLFADRPAHVAREIKALDLDNLTPMQALEALRKLKSDL